MNKDLFALKIMITALLLAAVPAGLFYYFDNIRMTQLNAVQAKILWAENQKETDLIKSQITKKLDETVSSLAAFSEEQAEKRYGQITLNKIIRDNSYSTDSQKRAIINEFKKESRRYSSQTALLYSNGSLMSTNAEALNSEDFRRDTKFLQARSGRTAGEVDFTSGTAKYFIPVNDTKNRNVAMLFVRENVTQEAETIRKGKLSAHGYNFVVETSGRMVLNTDKAKENSENILLNPDLRPVASEAAAEGGIKEATYNNFKGLLGYKKVPGLDLTACVFTPYADYKFMQKKGEKYESIFFDNRFFLPVYGILGGSILLLMLLLFAFTSEPYAPLKKIIRALTRIDEEGFEAYLPKAKSGVYRKISDALIILKGRIKAAESNAQKLSQMSKELEEELSKEASRADAEVSELRDAVKITESGKAAAEEAMLKAKAEAENAKAEAQKKIAAEKEQAAQKIMALEKDMAKLKEDVKKAAEIKLSGDKDSMRTDAVLMMNTELKGVLSVIKTYISSVLGGEGKITDAQQQFLGVVINKSARLERIINDLTELSRLEKSDIKLNKQPVDVNHIAQDIVFSMQPQADIKKVEIRSNFPPSIAPALGDSARLNNLISQLMNQAIKVSPRGGQVIVETRQTEKDVHIRLTDYGMSMPQSKAALLFTHFHGPESQSGPEFINTGLRFPILRAILNNMGGDITIESEIGKGKTFVISLPREKTGAPVSGGGMPNIKPAQPEAVPPSAFKPSAPAPSAPAPSAPVPSAPSQFKIQRNDSAFGASKPPAPEPLPGTAKEGLPTVSDLASFDIPFTGAKPELPGKDIVIPDALLNDKPPAPKSAPKAPDILPPLPDLEDDKGGM